jgi:hypothetical protein
MSATVEKPVELLVQIMRGAYVEDANLSMVLAQVLRCKSGMKISETRRVRNAAENGK